MASAGPSANHQIARRCTWQATACWISGRLSQRMAEHQWALERRTQASDLKRYRRTWRADRSALGTLCVPHGGPRVGRAAFSRGPYFRKGNITTRHNTKRGEGCAGPSLRTSRERSRLRCTFDTTPVLGRAVWVSSRLALLRLRSHRLDSAPTKPSSITASPAVPTRRAAYATRD